MAFNSEPVIREKMVNPGTSENEQRAQVVAAYKKAADLGLMKSTSGNISCRFAGGLLITPSGAGAADLAPERIVPMDLDGSSAGPGKPSSEWPMHARIYRRIPEARAIVHTHSDYCTALACCRKPIPAYHYLVAAFGGGDVPCVPYAAFGTAALAENAASGLKERTACLLGNHGMICHGPSLAKAVARAHLLEIVARQYVLALQAGGPVLLDPEEMDRVGGRMREYFG
jgi:L-fuculose-phosphate aldolase